MANSVYLNKLNGEERNKLIEHLWSIQKSKCFISGKDIDLDLHRDQLDIDHIIPLVSGGKDEPSNFAITFSSANRSKQGADLRLARTNYLFKDLTEKIQAERNENPNLTDVLHIYGGACYPLKFKIEGNQIKYSLAEINNLETHTATIYTDKLSKMQYFFALMPIEYIFHDNKINPRSIGSNVTKLIGEFFKGNPQLHVSLGYIENSDKNCSEIKLFDGQHKAAAQILLGVHQIPVRIFIDPNKDVLTETNTHAGTTLKQVAFDKSVQRHLGNTLYWERVQHYQDVMKLDKDNFDFSEIELLNFFKGETKELKRYIIDAVKDRITSSEDNRLRNYIDMGGRAKEKPLSYSTIEKTFYSFFINPDSLSTPINYKIEEGLNPRELEITQIIRLMNIIADNILVGKFDLDIGTYRIENRIQNGENLNWDHIVGYRMMKEEILYAWLRYINDIIITYYALMGKPIFEKHDFFEDKFPDQLWINIENFVKNLVNLPLWRSKEFSSTLFGGKQNYSFWKNIFLTGKSPLGEDVLIMPIDVKKMVLPLV
jgi:hypothetical protein